MKRLIFAVGLLLSLAVFAGEKSLTNDDVVKLVKLGLGDDVVVAKVKQAAVPIAIRRVRDEDPERHAIERERLPWRGRAAPAARFSCGQVRNEIAGGRRVAHTFGRTPKQVRNVRDGAIVVQFRQQRVAPIEDGRVGIPPSAEYFVHPALVISVVVRHDRVFECCQLAVGPQTIQKLANTDLPVTRVSGVDEHTPMTWRDDQRAVTRVDVEVIDR